MPIIQTNFQGGNGGAHHLSGEMLKLLLRNPLTIAAYRWIHPDVGIPFAYFVSRLSRGSRDESKVDFPVGVGVDMIASNPTDRTGHPGIGLENVGRRAPGDERGHAGELGVERQPQAAAPQHFEAALAVAAQEQLQRFIEQARGRNVREQASQARDRLRRRLIDGRLRRSA